jgi:hypothetical protein
METLKDFANFTTKRRMVKRFDEEYFLRIFKKSTVIYRDEWDGGKLLKFVRKESGSLRELS